jgi:hypothetical protein
VREVANRVCWPRLGNDAVVVDGLELGADAVLARRYLAQAPAGAFAPARQARTGVSRRVQGERSERAHAVFGLPGPLAVLSNAAARGSGRALV